MQVYQRGRIAAAERGDNGLLGQLRNLVGSVEIAGHGVLLSAATSAGSPCLRPSRRSGIALADALGNVRTLRPSVGHRGCLLSVRHEYPRPFIHRKVSMNRARKERVTQSH